VNHGNTAKSIIISLKIDLIPESIEAINIKTEELRDWLLNNLKTLREL
jgi:hypothetical protein